MDLKETLTNGVIGSWKKDLKETLTNGFKGSWQMDLKEADKWI